MNTHTNGASTARDHKFVDWVIAYTHMDGQTCRGYLGRLAKEREMPPAIELVEAYEFASTLVVSPEGLRRLRTAIPIEYLVGMKAIEVRPIALLRLSTLEAEDLERIESVVEDAEKHRSAIKQARSKIEIATSMPAVRS